MNRRAFLQTLAAGLAGAVLDPERLLWRPGAKTILLEIGPKMRSLHRGDPSNILNNGEG